MKRAHYCLDLNIRLEISLHRNTWKKVQVGSLRLLTASWIKSHILCCHILEILTINYPSLQVVWGNHKFNLGSQPNYFLLKSTSFGTSKNNLYLLHPPLFFTMRSVDSSPEYIHLCYCDLLLIWSFMSRAWLMVAQKFNQAGRSRWIFLSFRPVWSTYLVSDQPGTYWDRVSKSRHKSHFISMQK